RISWQIERKRQQLLGTRQRLRHPGEKIREHMQALDRLELRLQRGMLRLVQQRRTHLAQTTQRLARLTPTRRIEQSRQRLDQIEQLLPRLIQQHIERNRLRLAQQSGMLHSVSPLATLERGYSILLNPAGQAVSSAEQVTPGDRLDARLHKGRLTCTVESIETGE
ncbi:MAG: exodeoxyribonuclease VII large subunit, partial [Oceanospirillales bacterium]|nr:exodeoxyribonuclease VII large subunit [Oceanospirillales bacterium]